MTIHRRAEAWDAGDIPETLLTLCREHLQADAWHVLAKSGRSGYKASGLELEVDNSKNTHDAAEVAGAVSAMINEHHDAHGHPFYRVDAMQGKHVLGQVVLKLGPDGAEDLQSLSGGAWAIKELGATHKRYLDLLDKMGGVVDLAAQCMDAMAGAVASAADARLNYASGEAEAREGERNHEKQMRVMDFLMSHASTSKPGSNPLRDVLREMPAELVDEMKDIMGDDNFQLLMKAAASANPAERRNLLTHALERITEPQKVALVDALPKEWHSRLLLAFQSVLQGPAAGTSGGRPQPNGAHPPQAHP